ncbi:hypothetical protein L596_026242 [Steinernema carpocapsae]|uniref:C-type lectin domain-containing protein n=1 Tax=Steinernema carpocapsae TaxID=34508 RepID=A0A4U5M0S4_STECR|nr:hypothetical protein L596_026242 [Steinernema carpocapsae]
MLLKEPFRQVLSLSASMLAPLLFFGFLVTASFSANCFPDWIESNDGHCYILFEGHLSFKYASLSCVLLASHLASFHSGADFNKLDGQFDQDYYIGGTRKNGKWQWTDGSAFNYTHWAAGQPSKDKKKSCIKVDFVTGLWSSVDCSTVLAFLCKSNMDPNNQQTTWPPSHTSCPSASECHEDYVYTVPDPSFGSWNEAQQYCKNKHGGQLASIHDNVTESLVARLVSNADTNAAFLGGKIENGKLVWADGTPVDYMPTDFRGWSTNYHCLVFLSYAPYGELWDSDECVNTDFGTAAVCKYKMKSN